MVTEQILNSCVSGCEGYLETCQPNGTPLLSSGTEELRESCKSMCQEWSDSYYRPEYRMPDPDLSTSIGRVMGGQICSDIKHGLRNLYGNPLQCYLKDSPKTQWIDNPEINNRPIIEPAIPSSRYQIPVSINHSFLDNLEFSVFPSPAEYPGITSALVLLSSLAAYLISNPSFIILL